MSAAVSRTLALALVVLTLGALIFAVALPLSDRLRALEAEAAALTTQIARFREAAARAVQNAPPGIADQVYLRAGDPVLAAVALQEIVDAAITDAGGRVHRFEPGAPAPGAALRIPLGVEFSAPLPGLAQALHRLETTTPYVFVDTIDIRRAPQAPGVGEVLSVRLGVHGLFPGGGGPE